MDKLVYDLSEGDKDQKDLLCGKGANRAERTRLGLPVPPGFTITTDACRFYLERGRQPDQLRVQVTSTDGSATPPIPCWSPFARAQSTCSSRRSGPAHR